MPYKNKKDANANKRLKRNAVQAEKWKRMGLEVIEGEIKIIKAKKLRCVFCGKESLWYSNNAFRHYPHCVKYGEII